ncbi:MAG: polymer-forming cytoskeletal protein [Clostridia bacterium]|nr:polymer-forming cytoskeletal protein [Clostridia bacterium]
MTKKFFSVLMMMFVILISLTNVHATDGMFYMGAYSDIYKLSEQSDIDLPFINVFANAATYDKDVTHSGISIGDTTIDVNEKLEGMQVLVSTDMVTIKGEVENSFIYANNVVIEGKLTGDSIIFAPTVQILEGATVEKDVIIVANNLDLQGIVEGNVIATVSEKANISGVINQDLRMIVEDLVVENETIKGDVYIETNADTTALKEKYPNAVVKSLVEETELEVDWMSIFTKGIITVVIYSVICFLLTRKENNIVEKACKKFKANTTYGLLIAVITLMLVLVLPIILIIMALSGLGLIAWPILISYIALLLLVGTTAMLIVGLAIFDAVKEKVSKYKIPAIALIYIVLYALTQVPVIAGYANMAIMLVALAIVVTMFTKKLPKEEIQVEEKK